MLSMSIPFKWDTRQKRFLVSSPYAFWNYCLFTFYLSIYLFLLTLRMALNHVFTFVDLSHEDRQTNQEPLIFVAVDLAYIGVTAIVCCILSYAIFSDMKL